MSLRRVFRALRDNRGVAAIEFALILPILVILDVGASEFLQVYQAQRRIAHLAAAIGDITAQSRSVTSNDLTDIMNAGQAIMYPFGTLTLGQRISSMSANASGSVSTDWTVNRNYNDGSPPTVPSGYLLANESVIVTDVIFDYHPTFGFFLPDTLRFTRHAYTRPRLSTKVEKTS